MEMSPTKQRFSMGKFTSSVSNWNPSGNCSSGRKRWQKPAGRARSVRTRDGGGGTAALKHPVYLLPNVSFGMIFKV